MPSPRTAGVIRQEFLVHIAAKIQDPQRVTRALKRFWRFQTELGQRWNRPDLENLHRFVEAQKSQSSAVYALRCWLKFLFRQGLLLKPLHEELLVRNHRPRRKLVLSIEQMSQLLELPDLETLEGIRDRAALELAYGLGMRSGELVNLNLGDVDFGSGTIHIDCGKNGWARMLPLNRWAAHFLRLYLEKVRPEWVGPKSGVALWISPRDHSECTATPSAAACWSSITPASSSANRLACTICATPAPPICCSAAPTCPASRRFWAT
jgi:site-specific recombinase XerD